VLRQLGNGSIAEGVAETVRNTTAQNSMAAVLGVAFTTLTEELAQLPAGDGGGAQVDLSKMYSHLVAGSSADVVLDEDLNEHRAIFNWYAQAAVTSLHLLPCSGHCRQLPGAM
jgi:hypothetical protein